MNSLSIYNLHTPPVFKSPYGDSVGISQRCLVLGKLERLDYAEELVMISYVKPIRLNTGK